MDTSSVNETTGAGADSATSTVRWSRQRVEKLFDSPFNDLLHRAHSVHRRHFDPNAVQLSTLLSVKTGGCPEDCAYCPQAARYHTGVSDEDLLTVEQVTAAARLARANGATRFCMGAAWRGPRQRDLERVIEMVKAVRAEGLETCATLGLLKEGQAEQLRAAGLDYYNHNIDTAPEFYGKIITTRTQDDRLQTLARVRGAGIHVCCGGIIGMGERREDVVEMAMALRELGVQSIPINFLIPIDGTPLGQKRDLTPRYCLKVLAMFRLVNPDRELRIAGGREVHLGSLQALGLYAANSVFVGDYLTTTGQPAEADYQMIRDLGFEIVRNPEASHC